MGAIADALEPKIVRRAAEIAAGARDRLDRGLRRAAPVGEMTPGRTRQPGTLRDSISVSVRREGDQFRFLARADDEVAVFVQRGTRPHVIRARPGGVLAFYWPQIGGMAFFPLVHHPGTQPNPWWEQTLDRFPDLLREAQ